jgi:hypothetical protein
MLTACGQFRPDSKPAMRAFLNGQVYWLRQSVSAADLAHAVLRCNVGSDCASNQTGFCVLNVTIPLDRDCLEESNWRIR